MGSPARIYKALWLDCPGVTSSGTETTIRWKCLHYNSSGAVRWDLGTPLDVWSGHKDFRLCKFLRREMDAWQHIFKKFEWSVSEHFPLTSKQVRLHQGAHATDFTRTGSTASTQAVLFMFSFWASQKWRVADRKQARAMLRGFTAQILDPVFGLGDFGPRLLEKCAQGCSDDDKQTVCKCLEAVLYFFGREESEVDDFVHVVNALWLREDCKSCGLALPLLLENIAQLIDEALPKKGFSDDIVKNVLHRSGTKRRRVYDEDFVRYLTEDTIRLKRTAGALGVAQEEDVSAKRLRAWVSQNVEARITMGWKLGSSITGVLNITEDGARLSNPGEETQLYLAHAPYQKFSVMLPNQAPICVDGGTHLSFDPRLASPVFRPLFAF